MFRRSFQTDPGLSRPIFELIDAVFPGVAALAALARRRGAAWEEASTPFVRFAGDQAVAHVGVLEIPLRLLGRDVVCGGIHAVCTRPEYRRRGYYRSLIEEALAYCAGRYETLLLTTAEPDIYKPFGFRVIPEHAFAVDIEAPGDPARMRLIDPDEEQTTVLALLASREPVSEIVGVRAEKALFCVNEANRPLYYSEALGALFSLAIENRRLHLYDVVAPQMPTLAQICACLPEPVEQVIVYFAPDKLAVNARPFAHLLEGDSYLMASGNFAAEGEPLMLPRPARC